MTFRPIILAGTSDQKNPDLYYHEAKQKTQKQDKTAYSQTLAAGHILVAPRIVINYVILLNVN